MLNKTPQFVQLFENINCNILTPTYQIMIKRWELKVFVVSVR